MTKLERKKELAMYMFILPGILGFLFFWLIPIVYTFVLSIHKYDGFNPPKFIAFENYRKIFSDSLFWKSNANTLFMVVLGIPFNMTVAMCLALLLKMGVKGIRTFRTIFYMPTILPAVATAVVMFTLFNTKYGLLNKVLHVFGLKELDWMNDPSLVKFAFILVGTWCVGRTMIIFLVGLQSISTSYYEAALVDGANMFQKFFGITLPMLTPTILYNLILETVASIQIFTPAYIMTNGGPDNSTLFYVFKMYKDGFQYGKFGVASAEGVILFIVTLALTYLVMKSSNSWVHYEGGNKA